MAGRFWCRTGGIFALSRLISQNERAIRYDLLQHGYRLEWLGTDSLSWLDLAVIVSHSDPASSSLSLRIHGEYARWDLKDYLLAAAVDALNAANWQRTGRKSRRPKQIPRPVDKLKREVSAKSLKKNPMQSGIIGRGADRDSVIARLRLKNGR